MAKALPLFDGLDIPTKTIASAPDPCPYPHVTPYSATCTCQRCGKKYCARHAARDMVKEHGRFWVCKGCAV